ncbi:hypothetical protein L1987_82082 [Smallanthus sonchifolius]|uniref:Uncharacterized protein n=1 Tax=Smallanthus sonchifolius TaxID=185202 RepID=A0ACB8YSB7_9ASTR|nr:hypothetical protein L1987_82082 [Smallanthus sonchifolius]
MYILRTSISPLPMMIHRNFCPSVPPTAYDWLTCRYLIVSFDLTSEEFGEVYLPDGVSHPSELTVIYKLNDSLALLIYDEDTLVCDVWTMTSFTKLFTLALMALDNSLFYNIHGFRMNDNGTSIY